MSTIKTWQERFRAWRSPVFQDEPIENKDAYVATDHLIAEIAELRAALDTPPVASGALPELPEPLEINWPTLNRNALGCGVEDRGLHDRYMCAEYGWEDGVDRAIECVPEGIYDADQMHAYGQSCAAAAAPNAALVEALQKAQEDINWMLNNRQFLNGHVFEYIDAALAQAGAA